MRGPIQQELVAHLLCLMGVITDQVTTRIALTFFPTIYESNPIVAALIQTNTNLWLLFDLSVVIILLIGVHWLFTYAYPHFQSHWFLLLLPSLLFGFVRIGCGLHNIQTTLYAYKSILH